MKIKSAIKAGGGGDFGRVKIKSQVRAGSGNGGF
jgi:hypothetical protein